MITTSTGDPCRQMLQQHRDTMRDLNPYQYRLMDHYYEIGVCYQTTETTAAAVKFSTGKVSTTRHELQALGMITMKPMSLRELHERGLFEQVIGNPRTVIYVVTPVHVVNARSQSEFVTPNQPEKVSEEGAEHRRIHHVNQGIDLVYNLIGKEEGSAEAQALPPADLPVETAKTAFEHPYVQAWFAGTPKGKYTQPVGIDFWPTIHDLERLQVTPAEISEHVARKFAELVRPGQKPRESYAFKFIVEDLPGERLKGQTTISPVPKAQLEGIWHEPAPEPLGIRHNTYSPERRKQIIAEAKALNQALASQQMAV